MQESPTTMRSLLAVLITIFAIRAAAAPAPAPSLLLPYFSASRSNPAYDTSFTVTNATDVTQIARVTVWTDRGMPAVWFPFALSGRAAVRISMHELLNGRTSLPAPETASDNPAVDARTCIAMRAIGPPLLGDVRCLLVGGITSGVAIVCPTPASERHSHAVGYVTIDAVRSCSLAAPNDPAYASEVRLGKDVLTGDFEQTAAGDVVSAGMLVPLRGGTSLPSSMTIDVPPGRTELHIWRAPAITTLRCNDFEHAPPAVMTRRVRWRRKVTINSGRPMWVTAAKPSPPDPGAPAPATCDSWMGVVF